MREAFGVFASWAMRTTDPKRVTLDLTHHAKFFEHLCSLPAERWTGPGLLDHFGTAQLRTFEVATRWMAAQYGVVLDKEQKLHAAELSRIQNLLETPPEGSPARAVLAEFGRELLERLVGEELSVRTVRTSLRPAVDLLQRSAWAAVPRQSHLDEYLRASPGQRAATFAFVGFLNRQRHAELEMPSKRSSVATTAAVRKRRHERRINALLDESPRASDFEQRWLQEALAFFHQLADHDAKQLLSEGSLEREDEGFVVVARGKRFWVPNPDHRADQA